MSQKMKSPTVTGARELSRFTGHDPVRRGFYQSPRTQFRRNEVG